MIPQMPQCLRKRWSLEENWQNALKEAGLLQQDARKDAMTSNALTQPITSHITRDTKGLPNHATNASKGLHALQANTQGMNAISSARLRQAELQPAFIQEQALRRKIQ